MSCYKLLDGIYTEIEGMTEFFWWGSRNGERKIHWLWWDRMARTKKEGGMGFRGIREFNISLLGKQY
ncbi:unnamed protein product [Lathyrus sativus]|nr:unnamed protein product [Lathyrus sativus]